MKNYKGYFDSLRHIWTSEQELRFRSHLYKHNSTCFITQVIIQQIVTLSKYGHNALDIRHP